MLLSIVIPIYNAEKVLKRTLDSVFNQELKDSEWEFILVDDGSTDNSLQICYEYQKKYPNLIIVIQKENGGVSSARNAGMKIAKGEYIYFMDADDYLMSGGFRYLIDNFLNKDYDILVFSSVTINDFDINTIPMGKLDGSIVYDGFGCNYLKNNWQTFIWNQIYKLNFIRSNDISFLDMTISEDVMFNLELWTKNPKVRIVSSKIYRYINYCGSRQVTKKRNYNHLRKCIQSNMSLFSYISELNPLFKEKYRSNIMETLFQSLLRSFMSRILSSDISTSEFRDIKSKLNKLHLLPLNNIKSKYTRIINIIIQVPHLLPIYKFLYVNIFVPYFLPKLSRE